MMSTFYPRHRHISNFVAIVAAASFSTTKTPASSKFAKPVFVSNESQVEGSRQSNREHILILGGGIAGLSTARYLLSHTQRNQNLNITLIDRNVGILTNKLSPSSSSGGVEKRSSSPPSPSSYEQHQLDLPHFSVPSRKNGNMLCPSLTVPWTTRSLWDEAFLPVLKSYYISAEKAGTAVRPPSISFDWASLISDRNMV